MDLSSLPRPSVIQELNYETLLADMVAQTNTAFTTAGIDYDVGNLETDPIVILLQTFAYQLTLLRARINDAARANLIAFAVGSDLDHLGAFYDTPRLLNETDERYRARLVLAIMGRSPGGTEERYAAVAMATDVNIEQVRVYRAGGIGPRLKFAVLMSTGDGTPSSGVLDAVYAALNAPAVRIVSDVFDRADVIGATQVVQEVTAQVWLLPSAPAEIVDGLAARLQAAWATAGVIGFDLDPSWIVAQIFVPGVSRVVITTPASRVVVDENTAIALGAVNISLAGRSF